MDLRNHVYHHVSYQNEEGVVSPGDGNVISVGDNDGSCKLVSTHQKKHVNVPDYFPLSVLSLVIFIPIGLAAIANSLKVRKAIKLDDKPNAIDASNWALQHALTAIFVGPLLGCFLCLIIFLTMYQAHL
ncbi:uncharacterized protein LOC132719825 isoform X2 [Ruditapes philippinarum]|uniref:uncharacterized protein LOC132719825 isoform X2 n=1 Tax=Ruditapes philippinarum TaxID=129788 RepID=UPI00295BFE16|nr:uncharacterized protein LOC132719825 isoform X2 [Ruditapes philippinarum]